MQNKATEMQNKAKEKLKKKAKKYQSKIEIIYKQIQMMFVLRLKLSHHGIFGSFLQYNERLLEQSPLAGFNVRLMLDVCLGTHLVWTKMMA